MNLSVVIPAYNERVRIEDTLRSVQTYLSESGRSYEILVVNDGSTDGTLDVLRRLDSEISGLKVLSYEQNMGKGYAVRQGMLAASGELALLSDADLASPIEELPRLDAALSKGADVAVGSRAVTGSVREVHQSFIRETGGRALNLIIQALAVPGIMDTQCGFKLFRRECAQAVFPQCFLNGFGFDVEVLYLARRLGFKLIETPIRWAHKEGSKVSPVIDGLRIIADLFRIRLHKYDLRGFRNAD
ncbi:MAG: glycosyltransferase family 2 protein [Armatimonadota bacterium]|nr:glycosyltransferase family 2 protein [Armatimonadota bacterium]